MFKCTYWADRPRLKITITTYEGGVSWDEEMIRYQNVTTIWDALGVCGFKLIDIGRTTLGQAYWTYQSYDSKQEWRVELAPL
tara:strand:+ start:174 stop:419 length:246 start_codon:yes stop_codon:yes gene_type:complete